MIGIPVLLILIFLGGWPLIIATAVFEAAAVYETEQMFRAMKLPYYARMSVFWVWAMLACEALHGPIILGVLAGLMVIVAGAVVLGRDPGSFQAVMTTTWGSLYIGLLFMYLVALRQMDRGVILVLAFFGVVWVSDAMAYFLGRRFGRHKLMVHISPAKTWEGTIGGGLSGTLVGLLASPLLHLPWYEGALWGLVLAGVGVVGDLLESQFKRYVGVKDSGGVLPGHGGVLDRFDSALLALPFAYYLLKGLGIG